MPTPTKVSAQQVALLTTGTGTHELDNYLSDAEIGGHTLAELLSTAFDDTGTPKAAALQSTGTLLQWAWGGGPWTTLIDIAPYIAANTTASAASALAASNGAAASANSASAAHTSELNAAASASAASSIAGGYFFAKIGDGSSNRITATTLAATLNIVQGANVILSYDDTTKTLSIANPTHAISDIVNLTSALSAKTDKATTLTGAQSLTGGGDLSSNRAITLLNDQPSPAGNSFYGTDASGIKGWQHNASDDAVVFDLVTSAMSAMVRLGQQYNVQHLMTIDGDMMLDGTLCIWE